jgi:hypothetical protein
VVTTAYNPSEQDIGGLRTARYGPSVAGLGDPAVPVGLTRLVFARHQSEVRAYGSGAREAFGDIRSAAIDKRRDGPDPRPS